MPSSDPGSMPNDCSPCEIRLALKPASIRIRQRSEVTKAQLPPLPLPRTVRLNTNTLVSQQLTANKSDQQKKRNRLCFWMRPPPRDSILLNDRQPIADSQIPRVQM